MKSIERRFNKIMKSNPPWSSWTCFVVSIKGQKFNKKIINRWFNQLVDKDDYDESEKKELVQYLYKVSDSSNTSEECQIQG